MYFNKENGNLVYRYNGETVMIMPWHTDSLRVCAYIGRNPGIDRGALLEEVTHQAEISINNDSAVISNGKISAELCINKFSSLQITFKNSKEKILLREISHCGMLKLKAREFKLLHGGSYRLKASFESPEERIYGMGQYQQEVMDLKGCILELAHRNSQASVPFYVSDRGYGFLWNNPAIGQVSFGKNITQWISEQTTHLDYWITAGDTPAEIISGYSDVTGKTPMMPEYGLGFWQSKFRYFNQKQVISTAREYKKRGITPDVLVIDFYHWTRNGDWHFDKEFFPNPAEMIKEIKNMGIEPVVSIWPMVDFKSENYEEMKQKGMLIGTNSGANVQALLMNNCDIMDATNPETGRFLWNVVKKNYYDLGIKTFWLDEAEPEFTEYDFENYRYYAGQALEKGNIYPKEYSRIFYDGLKESGEENILNLVRCAWAGSQRYGALVWSGDIHSTYEDFRKQICAGIHMGMSGIPWWTTDIGGFSGGYTESSEFQELLVRWFQFGTFCPVMRLHGLRLPDVPVFRENGEECVSTGADNEIWSFGEENYIIFKKYIGIRELMRDYLRILMKEAHECGSPVMRGLFYEFPKDINCRDIKDSFMLGSDILVAPVCREKAVRRRVYLPEGAAWTLAANGEVYKGGREYEIDAPIDKIPVFLRDGKQNYLVGKI